ncbi:MAG: hypothetical protein OSA99_08355 [Acidimicrobiales bacterium]|nr:hypothetical protein [Acidimicrobiales bacterium]
MGTLFVHLDHEWLRLRTARELIDATRDVLELAGDATHWGEAQKWMRSTAVHPECKHRVLSALVNRATHGGDREAARIVLALLMPGLVVELDRHRPRPNAEGLSSSELEAIVVEITWGLICQYPTHRQGNVAANILLDLRKRLCARPISVRAILAQQNGRSAPAADDQFESHFDVTEIVAHAVESRHLSDDEADLILDISVRGVSCQDAAAQRCMSIRTLRRRQRAAETRLGSHAREAFAA